MSVQTQIDRITGEVSEQETLLDQALTAIANKTAGSGSGGVVKPLNATPSKEPQTFTPSGFDGYAPVNIEAIPDSYIQPSGTKNVTVNGIHDVSSFASVNVNVPTEGGSGDLDDVKIVESTEQATLPYYTVSVGGDKYFVYGQFTEDTLFRAGSRVIIIVPVSDMGG